jgi:alkylhydroperoxidase/carboxymuconolactone decarboxylase family protein YurZ
MLGAALTVGVTPVEAKEIVYQAVPYAGMGRVFDFIHATNQVLTDRGVKLPLEGQATTTAETRGEKGRAVQEQIVGVDRVQAMYGNAPGDQLHLQQFLSANCFGDYLTRSGIDIGTRELLTFSMLISLGGVDPKPEGTSLPTSTSATPASSSSTSSPSSCPSSATPAPSTPWPPSTGSPGPDLAPQTHAWQGRATGDYAANGSVALSVVTVRSLIRGESGDAAG